MANATFSIVMPAQMKAFVAKRLRSGSFGNASEYFRHLVREDQRRLAQERLEGLLLDGESSGEPAAVDDAWWARKRADLTARAREERGRRKKRA